MHGGAHVAGAHQRGALFEALARRWVFASSTWSTLHDDGWPVDDPRRASRAVFALVIENSRFEPRGQRAVARAQRPLSGDARRARGPTSSIPSRPYVGHDASTCLSPIRRVHVKLRGHRSGERAPGSIRGELARTSSLGGCSSPMRRPRRSPWPAACLSATGSCAIARPDPERSLPVRRPTSSNYLARLRMPRPKPSRRAVVRAGGRPAARRGRCDLSVPT